MLNYTLVEDYDYDKFIANVTLLLNNGWKLQGGVSIAWDRYNQHSLYCQALIKK